ncbi:MAG: DUF1343 domain-containing protein [Verrucomicrobia bacterium]|nr:DUF1343 domain-containing protein [Verrucomicrobiota bacterium]
MRTILFSLLFPAFLLFAKVSTGIDRFFDEGYADQCKGKRIGLVTNQTGVNANLESSVTLFKKNGGSYQLVALFGPEHGIDGAARADEPIAHAVDADGLPLFSLYGATRRPTQEMLKNIDILIFDIQDVGTRCYTYASTLFYCMEEAARFGVKVVVLDRPNPINGVTVDGPMLDLKWRSFIGYLDIPFCHGMTLGELARYFNGEYEIGCELEVVPLKGWKREMTFAATGLPWTPTSPHIPSSETPQYYPMTNLIGEVLTEVSLGVGYTLPFQVVGAPWINGDQLAQSLNSQNFPGIRFQPYRFRPFFGRCQGKECRGVRLVVTDPVRYRPVATQFLILGLLKSLYPTEFERYLTNTPLAEELFCKSIGSSEALEIIRKEEFISWKLIGLHQERREAFLAKRAKYLLY